jgi:hypothetical protein
MSELINEYSGDRFEPLLDLCREGGARQSRWFQIERLFTADVMITQTL